VHAVLGLSRDRRAATGGAPLFAVAALVLLLAADLPLHEGAGGGSRGVERLDALVERERAEVVALAKQGWEDAPAPEAPLPRGRWAADAVRRALADRYPLETPDGAAVRFEGEVTVEVGGGLLSDVEVRVVGGLRAQRGHSAVERTVDARAEDPTRALPRAVVDAAVFGGIEDGASRAGAAFRAALARDLSRRAGALPESAPAAVARALERAAWAAQLSLGLLEDEGAAGAPVATPLPPPDLGGLVRSLAPTSLADFVHALCQREGCPSTVNALLGYLTARPATLSAVAEHVARHAAVGWSPFPTGEATLQALVDAARVFLAYAIHRLQQAVSQAWERWAAWNDAGDRLPAPRAPAHVAYLATGVSARVERALGPALAGGEVVFPFELEAAVRFQLHSLISVPLPGGGRLVAEDSRQVEVRVGVPTLGAGPAGLAVVARPPGPASFPLAPAIAHALDLSRTATEWAAELSARFARLRESVHDRLEEELATALSRLVFRVLDAAMDGDQNRTARALLQLLDGVFAGDLKEALTVNFTAYGRDFSLVPDPLRREVTLTHREGPHSFGVRLRHVGSTDNPFHGRHADYLSLALEFLWTYRQGNLSADLVIDPLMRTGDGLVRFSLVSRAGRGMALDLVAPRVTRVAHVVEVSLSKVVPGGLPLMATPTGGVLEFDMAARAEFLEFRRTTVARWLVGAMEAAWIDTVAGMSVGEVGEHLARPEAAGRLAGRFLVRLADVVVAEASKLLSRVEVAVSFVDREAGGLAAGAAEFALTLLEPAVIFREMASDIAAVAVAGPRPYARATPVELLPESVHTRVGASTRLRLSAGLGAAVPAARDLLTWPEADIVLDLFASLGAIATMGGRESLRSVERLSVGWAGFALSPAGLLPHTDLDRNDRVELFAATVRSLVGTRLLITEVMAAPEGRDARREYVEIHNPGFAEARLDGWALRDASGRMYALPAGTRIGPGGFLVVARSLEGFVGAYGRLPDVSTLTVALNDGRETLELVNAEGWTSDWVEWGGQGTEGLVPGADQAIARRTARVAPSALPGSAVQWTGSLLDFALAPPTPGSAGQ